MRVFTGVAESPRADGRQKMTTNRYKCMDLSYATAFIDMAKCEAITIIVSNGTWMDNCFGLHFFCENPKFCARSVQLL